MTTIIDKSNDVLLEPFAQKLSFEALKYQVGQTMFCRGCDEILDCHNAVSFDFHGVDSGKLHATFCLCGRCADRLDVAPAIAKGEAAAKEKLTLTKTDGRLFDEDGFPIEPMVFEPIKFGTAQVTGWTQVCGKRVKFPGWEEFGFGVYANKETFFVVEFTCGFALGRGETEQGAAVNALKNLEKNGKEKFAALIQDAILNREKKRKEMERQNAENKAFLASLDKKTAQPA